MAQQLYFAENYFCLQYVSNKNSILIRAFLIGCLLINFGTEVSAQIIPDNSLPNNSIPLSEDNVTEITGGTTVGNNLFHSFEQFSLPQENIAWFNNAMAIDNIISRVTGNSISNIDGLIKANGTANLFLINPKGIIFGENSALDIGGSFIATTADSLKFADNTEFSAVNPQESPLLTVSIPVGLQYGHNNGDIVLQGNGNQLQFNPNFTVNRNSRPRGLEVRPGKTLGLIGGNLILDGGNLTAETGSIQLGAVADNQGVEFDLTESSINFNYSDETNFRDINLINASSLEVSGTGGGKVELQGKQVIIVDGSAILADTVGDIDGKNLQVNASELLVVAGTAQSLPFISRLSTDVAPSGKANGGDIELNSANMIIADGAQIISSSYGEGNTGNIKVNADYLELFRGSPILNSSGLFTLVFGAGNGGDIDIKANSILVSGGGQAATLTFSNGEGGDLFVNSRQIELSNTSPGGSPSSFLANVESGATGNGGQLVIATESLLVKEGGQIAVTNLGEGQGGTLNVKANFIELIGASSVGNPSGLFSNVESSGTGNGGRIIVDVDQLKISDGAQISGITFGTGAGGDIDIQGDNIELIGISTSSPSGFQSTVAPLAEGDGGSLAINTRSLKVVDGGQIAVSTAGIGQGGKLAIQAEEIELQGRSEFGASGIFGNAVFGTGDGGNLEIKTDSLTVLDGATISASNFSSRNNQIPPGEGKAGSISIDANNLRLDTHALDLPSSITASTNNSGGGNIVLAIADNITINNKSEIDGDTKGNSVGGNIQLNTSDLSIESQGRISVDSTGIGNAGNIEISASNFTGNNSSITATSDNSGGGDIQLNIDNIFLDRAQLSTSVDDGTGGGGNLLIDSKIVIGKNNSSIIAKAVRGDGGNIDITTEVFLLTVDTIVDASSESGVDGVVDINSVETTGKIDILQLPERVIDPTALVARICPKDGVNTLSTIGKGGLAENPSQNLRGRSIWEDLRDFAEEKESSNNQGIVEAKAWNINHRGKLELVSHLPQSSKADYGELFNQCSSKD